jgi:DNA-directed RNA polymerase subunit K/omega
MSTKKVTEEAVESQQGEQKPPDMAFFLPNDENQSVYRFILAASKRARQLQGGARATTVVDSRKPTRIGMEEVRTGTVPVEILAEDAENPYAMMRDQPIQDSPAGSDSDEA